MRLSLPIFVTVLLCTSMLIGVGGCSDDATVPPTSTRLSGTVQKGAVSNAHITVRKIEADGFAPFVAARVVTDALGRWSVELPKNSTGPYLVSASGGSYTDEVTTNPVVIPMTSTLYGVIVAGTSGHITPITDAVYRAAQDRMSSGEAAADALAASIDAAIEAFGFDVTTTFPSSDASATTTERQYAALLGGISKLLADNAGILPDAAPFDLVAALAVDLSDGLLDGFVFDGAMIVVSTGSGPAPFPALDATGIGALLTAANQYGAGLSNPPPPFVDKEFSPVGFRVEVIVRDDTGTPVEGLRVNAGSRIACDGVLGPWLCKSSAASGVSAKPAAAVSLRFSLEQQSTVTLTIKDAEDNTVRVLVDAVLPVGAHNVFWDGRDDAGQAVRSAVYQFCLVARDPESGEVLYEPECALGSLYTIVDAMVLSDAIGQTDAAGLVATESKLAFPYFFDEPLTAVDATGQELGPFAYSDTIIVHVADDANPRSTSVMGTIGDRMNRFHVMFSRGASPATAALGDDSPAPVVRRDDPTPVVWSFGPLFPNPFN